MDINEAKAMMEVIQSDYPEFLLVPFARRFDNDDVACWDMTTEEEVVIVHMFSSADYALRQKYPSFLKWFEAAIREMVEWIVLECDYARSVEE